MGHTIYLCLKMYIYMYDIYTDSVYRTQALEIIVW